MGRSIVVLSYGELMLKGMNKKSFIMKLLSNVKNVIGSKFELKPEHDGLVIYTDNRVVENLKGIFGVANIYSGIETKRDLDEIVEECIKNINGNFSIKVKRVDKTFPLTSNQIEAFINKKIASNSRKIDIKNPVKEVIIKILKDRAYIFFEKAIGAGGLPVGVSGKVVVLISGGIDSAVAAWLIMKRGCKPDFIHFYSMKLEDVMNSKIPEIIKKIINYNGVSARLYLIPYHIFELEYISRGLPQSVEVVAFRAYMNYVAGRIGKYKAIVTGDSLAQVASQTIENINIADRFSSISVFRPLISYDKNQIIDIARNIGTYELSLKEYKDCCSIISKRQDARPDIYRTLEIIKKLDFEKLFIESKKRMHVIKL